ncbi:MAG: ABC transporter permease [Anaeromicrobium sp.]|jgi:ABC-type multidrug transport system permease subunit|uniref:ABC transporter permease n=1 Tax=Anaeromicrobium sp. TaxID=1929132 RepID=UPI0025E9939E|nr:ABC transporter permease [Anaeromicrobium sp.]MCT4595666.1 ABC transporter permease [Anaeromicrobium sp.]
MEISTILWREFKFFQKRAFKITSQSVVTPLLYLLAFGWGLGSDIVIDGNNYMHYIIPGIIAMSTMHTSFNAVSIRISVARLHEKSFEDYMTAPVNLSLLTLGYILAGALRGLYAGMIILLISYLFKAYIHVNFSFVAIALLNSLLFAAFGYYAAMVINSHYDMNRFTSFIITPMTFICGTFFSLDKMPLMVKKIIYVLPLTHTINSLRGIALRNNFDYTSIFVLICYIVVFYILGVYASYREIN